MRQKKKFFYRSGRPMRGLCNKFRVYISDVVGLSGRKIIYFSDVVGLRVEKTNYFSMW